MDLEVLTDRQLKRLFRVSRRRYLRLLRQGLLGFAIAPGKVAEDAKQEAERRGLKI